MDKKNKIRIEVKQANNKKKNMMIINKIKLEFQIKRIFSRKCQ